MVDTCQAMTLFEEIDSKDVICIGSSVRGENSYARGVSSCIVLACLASTVVGTVENLQAARLRAISARCEIPAFRTCLVRERNLVCAAGH